MTNLLWISQGTANECLRSSIVFGLPVCLYVLKNGPLLGTLISEISQNEVYSVNIFWDLLGIYSFLATFSNILSTQQESQCKSVCLSFCLSIRFVVTLTWSFFIGFLLFIYGLLPSNSHPSSNMGFVGPTINYMADKMAAACLFALVDTLT